MYRIDEYDQQEILEKIGFSNLLNVLFDCSDYFSLNRATWARSTDDTLKNRLESFLEKKLTTPKWFGYDNSFAAPEDYWEIEVYIYRAVPEAKTVFLDMFSDIFLRTFQDGDYQDSCQTLEDLCFFHDKKLIMGTVAHEYILSIEPINSAIRNMILQSEGWYTVIGSDIMIDQVLGPLS